MKLNHMLNPKLLIVALSAILALQISLSTTSHGQENGSKEETPAFDIAAHSDRSDRGYENSRVAVTMILKNAAGAQTGRKLVISTLEVPDEDTGDRTLVLFSAPRDISGTALLSHAHILEPDDQWLFLPAVNRIKRISTANKSGPFVGSEFAFEDITGQELKKYSYSLLEPSECGSLQCDRLDRQPLYEGSAYSHQIAWIDTKDHQIRKVEFFDRKGQLLKTLNYSQYRLYEGEIWRAHRMTMDNHQTKKSTQLVFEDYEFKLNLSERDFTKSSLSRLS